MKRIPETANGVIQSDGPSPVRDRRPDVPRDDLRRLPMRARRGRAMNPQSYRVGRTRRIEAHPRRVYAAIADYREHHPRILPRDSFRRLDVLEGGIGAGTRTRVEMRVLGTTRVFEQRITEPEPGRVLVETNQDGSAVTTFTVERAEGGKASQVTISTELPARPGVFGFLEQRITSWLLLRIYQKELANLANHVTSHPAG